MLHYKVIKEWKENIVNNTDDFDKKLDMFKISFAYNSAKIENLNIDNKTIMDIFKYNKILNFTGSVSTILEQINQRDVYYYLMPLIFEKKPISIKLIKNIHFQLTKGTYNINLINIGEKPGEFKIGSYTLGNEPVGTLPENIENELVDLINEINVYKGDEIYKVGTYFYAAFENIHPFADGNSMVGRALMNYFYMIKDYPPIIIYNEDKMEYNNCLSKYHRSEKLDDLIIFMKEQLLKTWL